MPYYETQVEKELLEEGRLKSPMASGIMIFRKNGWNDYYDFIVNSFMKWLRYPTA